MILLQIGSQACARCPAVSDAIRNMQRSFEFEWVYADALDSDVVEQFKIKTLPAFVIVQNNNNEPYVKTGASPHDVETSLAAYCSRKLVLDADF